MAGDMRWSLRSFWWCAFRVGHTRRLLRTPKLTINRYDTGTISGIIAMDYWKEKFSTTPDKTLTPSEDSLIVSILSAVGLMARACRVSVDFSCYRAHSLAHFSPRLSLIFSVAELVF